MVFVVVVFHSLIEECVGAINPIRRCQPPFTYSAFKGDAYEYFRLVVERIWFEFKAESIYYSKTMMINSSAPETKHLYRKSTRSFYTV